MCFGLKEDFHILTKDGSGVFLDRVTVKRRDGDGPSDDPSGTGTS